MRKKKVKFEVRHGFSRYAKACSTFEEAKNLLDSGAYPVVWPEKACVVKITTEVMYDPNNLVVCDDS